MQTAAAGVTERISKTSPEALFTFGAVSQYLGAAIAVGMFDRLDAPAVAWLRVMGAAIILVLVRKSWQQRLDRSQLMLAIAFGVATAGMNLFFYLAVEQLHLGTAVAIEFLGPIAVAAVGTRSVRNAGALALAIGGVALLAEVTTEGSSTGVLFALLAGTFWAGYIVLGHRLAHRTESLNALGISMGFGALALAPVAVWSVGPALRTPWLLLLGLATGLLSNAIPYGVDQTILSRISRARFALLQALLPVTAVLIGMVALGQVPSLAEGAGIALVVGALALGSREQEAPSPR